MTTRKPSKIEQQVADLNNRLYAAATKAGFVQVLRDMQIEVVASYYTQWKPVVTWNPEVLEAGVDRNADVLARAESWLAKALAA